MFLGIYFFLSCPIFWCIIFKQVPESESLYYFCVKRFLCQLTKQPSWLEHGGNDTKDVGSVPIWASASLLLLTHWIILLQSSNKLEITSQTSTWEGMLTSFVLQQWHYLPSPPPLPPANAVPAKNEISAFQIWQRGIVTTHCLKSKAYVHLRREQCW